MDVTSLRRRLSDRLRTAMRARDGEATSALRSLLGALDNATAVAAPDHDFSAAPLGKAGLGAGDAARRELTLDEVEALFRDERAELAATIDALDVGGRAADSVERRRALAVVDDVLAEVARANAERAEWDQRYGEGADGGGPLWSGEPNGTLIVEVEDLPAGTALDVGCGEGGDAVWLATRGWEVTAVDPSGVALARARDAAARAGVEVTFVQAGLLTMPDGPGQHDLVTAQYAVLRQSDDDAAIHALLGAVAPGGTLLYVHHDLEDVVGHGHDEAHDHDDGHDHDPDEHVLPHDVAPHLDEGWEVEVLETRPRPGPLPEDARHVRDVVLRARRR